jgi:hypothetical protein
VIVEHLRHSPLRRAGRHQSKRKGEECPPLNEHEAHLGTLEKGREIVDTFASVTFSRSAHKYKPRSSGDLPLEALTAAPRHESQAGSAGYQRKLIETRDDPKNAISAREKCRRGLR